MKERSHSAQESSLGIRDHHRFILNVRAVKLVLHWQQEEALWRETCIDMQLRKGYLWLSPSRWPWVRFILGDISEMKCSSLSCVRCFATPWTVACQAPLSSGILQPRIVEWLPFPTPRDLPNLGVERASLIPPALAGGFATTCTAWEAQLLH